MEKTTSVVLSSKKTMVPSKPAEKLPAAVRRQIERRAKVMDALKTAIGVTDAVDRAESLDSKDFLVPKWAQAKIGSLIMVPTGTANEAAADLADALGHEDKAVVSQVADAVNKTRRVIRALDAIDAKIEASKTFFNSFKPVAALRDGTK